MTKEEINQSIKELQAKLSTPFRKYIPFPVDSYIHYRVMLLRKNEIEMSIADGTLTEETAKFPLSIVNEAIENFQITIEKSIKEAEKTKLSTPNVKWEHPLIEFTKIGIKDLNKLLKKTKYENDFELIKNAVQFCETELEILFKEYGNK